MYETARWGWEEENYASLSPSNSVIEFHLCGGRQPLMMCNRHKF